MTWYWCCSHRGGYLPGARNRAWSEVLCWISSGNMVSSLTRISIETSRLCKFQARETQNVSVGIMAVWSSGEKHRWTGSYCNGRYATSPQNAVWALSCAGVHANKQAESSDSIPGNLFLYIWNAVASYIHGALNFWSGRHIKLFWFAVSSLGFCIALLFSSTSSADSDATE